MTESAEITRYGLLSSGEAVDRIRLRSTALQVDVITFGARVISLLTPDVTGVVADVTLGLADLAAYEADRDYLGACVGRFANRIRGGRFELGGQTFQIPLNESTTALHGGTRGFERMLWEAEVGAGAEVRLSRVSRDGEMGFPGDLDVTVTYRLQDADLMVEYEATTSATTIVNLTNHSYFNLAGGGNVEAHIITVDADHFLPVDDDMIPTGERRPVDGTPLDLRSPVAIGSGLRKGSDEQLRKARGYDHTFVVGRDGEIDVSGDVRRAARVEEPGSGRIVELWTDRPGVQVYTGNSLDGTAVGRDGTMYRQTDAFCLEPQYFPDSPNQPDFPSTVLRPGDTYRARDIYRFA
ncbi:MAG: aldose epimerase family protein [Nocardioidaceae bacterium]